MCPQFESGRSHQRNTPIESWGYFFGRTSSGTRTGSSHIKVTRRSLLRCMRSAGNMSLLNVVEHRREERSDAWQYGKGRSPLSGRSRHSANQQLAIEGPYRYLQILNLLTILIWYSYGHYLTANVAHIRIPYSHAGIAQLIERFLAKEEARSLSLLARTI